MGAGSGKGRKFTGCPPPRELQVVSVPPLARATYWFSRIDAITPLAIATSR